MYNILQINVDRSRTAQNMIYKTITEKNIDIVAGQEPNKKIATSKGLLCDNRQDAFIITHSQVPVESFGRGDGYVYVELEQFCIVSCYYSPNTTLYQFKEYLDNLDVALKNKNKPLIVCGDFNSKSLIFGSSKTDKRGELLEELICTNNLAVINRGQTPTFSNANGSSIIDITLCSDRLANRITNWEVNDDYENFSSHNNIFFTLKNNNKILSQPGNNRSGWKISVSTLDRLSRINWTIEQQTVPNTPEDLVRKIQETCNKTLIKKRQKHKYLPVYWWTPELAEIRTTCKKERRLITRLNASKYATDTEKKNARQKYLETKRLMKRTVQKEKNACWAKLCDELNDDIWGKAYKIVTKKILPNPKLTLNKEDTLKQISKLFPTKPKPIWPNVQINNEQYHLFSEEELSLVMRNLKNNRSPGPDLLTSEILKAVIPNNNIVVLKVMNDCLSYGIFPKIWKTAQLILIEKPKKDPTIQTPPAFRPICLIDGLAKILESLIKLRLETEMEEKNVLHPLQFGFRKGRSTIDAIKEVGKRSEEMRGMASRKRGYSILITLDVENAFNSAPWEKIYQAIQKANFSLYLQKILQSYLTDRTIITPHGEKMDMTCGVPQGSILGPTLWNIFYDQILHLDLGEGVKLVAYADDLAVVVHAKTTEILQNMADYAIIKISEKLREMNINLAPHKTEVVILEGRRKFKEITLNILGNNIRSQPHLKYMGITISKDYKFKEHIIQTSAKALKLMSILTRIMPNIGGPTYGKRKLLAQVATSTILYGAQIWMNETRHKYYHNILEKAVRKAALRITTAYVTAPTTALLALAKTPPIALQIEERARSYGINKEEKKKLKTELTDRWQEIWAQYNGWTKTFITYLPAWLKSNLEITHYSMQALTGHGVFGSYLHRIGKKQNPLCWFCSQIDNPEHTIFECPRFKNKREALQRTLQTNINTTNISMYFEGEGGKHIMEYLNSIMKEKVNYEIQQEKQHTQTLSL